MDGCELIFRRKFFIVGLFFLVSTFLSGPWGVGIAAESGQVAGDAAMSTEYLIGVGDILEVSVWKEPDISRSAFVRLDGRISLPLIGDVVANGLSLQALTQKIREKIAKYITDPSVTVTLTASKSKMYYVLGQIAKPGEYSLDYPLTILQVIAKAGGLNEWAKKSRIMVVRQDSGQQRMVLFDYEEFLSGKGLAQNILIAPGDTIIVP